MDLKREDNWLTVAEGVVLTEDIERSILGARRHFALHSHKATVTSGLRTKEQQLFGVILKYAERAKVENMYPEFDLGVKEHWMVDKKVTTPEGHIYWWQRTWSRLLNKNYIINPPLAAMCLYNSFRQNGTNRKGTVIQQTPHADGRCYDIGGGINHSPNDEYAILLEAKQDPEAFIRRLTLETMNNSVHVDVV